MKIRFTEYPLWRKIWLFIASVAALYTVYDALLSPNGLSRPGGGLMFFVYATLLVNNYILDRNKS